MDIEKLYYLTALLAVKHLAKEGFFEDKEPQALINITRVVDDVRNHPEQFIEGLKNGQYDIGTDCA